MRDDIVSPADEFRILQPPPLAKWKARLTPGGFACFYPTEGNVPNWFHRQMQRLCFGIVWERTS